MCRIVEETERGESIFSRNAKITDGRVTFTFSKVEFVFSCSGWVKLGLTGFNWISLDIMDDA